MTSLINLPATPPLGSLPLNFPGLQWTFIPLRWIHNTFTTQPTLNMIRHHNRTLIRFAASLSAAFSRGNIRCLSTLSEGSSSIETVVSESEARAVEKIEAAIHGIIVKKSIPTWLPFVPGASYWVPPRQSSYGIAEIVHKIANPLKDDECLSLVSSHGWPSSEFYIQDGTPSDEELEEAETSSSAKTSV